MPFKKGEIPEGATPFQPGQSGNPSGRPKKLKALEEMLENILGEDKDGVTAAEAILMKLRQKAASGDIKAAEVLLDRYYGKAKQFMEVYGKDGAPLINIVMPPGE